MEAVVFHPAFVSRVSCFELWDSGVACVGFLASGVGTLWRGSLRFLLPGQAPRTP